MPKLLVFQHVAWEILGTLDPLLRSYGFRNRYVNFGRHPDAEPSIDGYHGLVVLGGPMNVGQTEDFPHLETERAAIREAIGREMPVLGICLGAQLIAHALGAEVRASPEKEIGWYDVRMEEAGRTDPLFSHFEPEEKIFQWHGDTFEIPDGAVHLASSRGCPNQAFRYGHNVYGLQFHLEVDAPLVERWLGVSTHVAEIEELAGRIAPDTVRRDTRSYVDRLRKLSDETFSRFAEITGATRRRSPVPHR